jgi:uncharacterized repeat protein (TIGR01451 family)
MLICFNLSLSRVSAFASYLHKIKFWLAGSTTIFTAIATYPSTALAVTNFPSLPNLQFQTSEPSRPATIGDWYTTNGSASTDKIHRFVLDISQADLNAVGGTITVTINDAESNGALDEVNGGGLGVNTCTATTGNCDPTQFSLRAANGTTILQGPTTVASGSPDGSTVTFTITAPGTYQVTSVTGAGPISGDFANVALNDDDNTFTMTTSGNNILIGSFQGSSQFSANRATPYSFYFIKAPTANSGNLLLRNFDYDRPATNPPTIQYISPLGGSGTTSGTISGNGVWNGAGATINSGSDVVPATSLTDAGVWEIRVSATTGSNQFLLEANLDTQRLILFDALPTELGNFIIAANTTLSTTIGATVCHPLSVTNNFATNDIINLTTANTAPNYTAQLRNAAGTTPLTDTDGNGQVDTGILTPGQVANYTLCVTPNPGVTTPDTTRINAVSFLDTRVGTTNTTLFVDKTTTVPPNLFLIKRITAINGVDINGFQDGVDIPTTDPNFVGAARAPEDNNALWPAPNTTSLRGTINSNTLLPAIALKPGDEVEYTIYFLNNGAAQANNVSICDFIPANQTYVDTGFNNSSFATDAGGLAGSNYGIALLNAFGTTPVRATNASDGDRGQFYSSGFPSSCIGTNSGKGAVVVNLGNVPNATSAGTPTNSYGFIRFKAKIN